MERQPSAFNSAKRIISAGAVAAEKSVLLYSDIVDYGRQNVMATSMKDKIEDLDELFEQLAQAEQLADSDYKTMKIEVIMETINMIRKGVNHGK